MSKGNMILHSLLHLLSHPRGQSFLACRDPETAPGILSDTQTFPGYLWPGLGLGRSHLIRISPH